LKMKAGNWILTVMVLLSVNGAWIWRSVRNHREYSGQVERIKVHYNGMEREIFLLKKGWKYAMRTDGCRLPGSMKARLENGSATTLGEMIGNTGRLLLILSWRHCSSCIDQLLFTMKQNIPVEGRKQVDIICCSDRDDDRSWEYRRKILPGVRFVKISGSGLKLPADSLEVPYFTVVGRELRTTQTYIPYPSLAEETEAYIHLIANKYLND
jgi:hypothetical protein